VKRETRGSGRKIEARNPLGCLWTGFDEIHGQLCRSCLHCKPHGMFGQRNQAGTEINLISNTERKTMKDMLLKLYVKAQIIQEDGGQDLIEYALVAALIAFAAVAGMNGLSGKINTAFSTIGSKLTSALT
jgi:pilus assembly protein Flp/PilA